MCVCMYVYRKFSYKDICNILHKMIVRYIIYVNATTQYVFCNWFIHIYKKL